MPFYLNPTTTSSSQFPEFSTQPNLVPEQASGSRNEKTRWITKDDILLCSVWLNICKDVIVEYYD